MDEINSCRTTDQIRLATEDDIPGICRMIREAGETVPCREWFISDSEEEMLKEVTAAFDRTIVLLNVGNIIDMEFVSKYDIKSVLPPLLRQLSAWITAYTQTWITLSSSIHEGASVPAGSAV